MNFSPSIIYSLNPYFAVELFWARQQIFKRSFLASHTFTLGSEAAFNSQYT